MREPFEEVPAVSDFVRFKLGWILLAAGLLVALGLPPLLTESQFSHTTVGTIGTLRDPTESNGTPEQIEKRTEQAEAVPTSGSTAPAVIRQLEATGRKGDGHELIGRKVDVTVPVQSRANDQAFWIGTGDDEMLVVVHRDNRSAEQRYFGVPSGNAIDDAKAGQRVTITGTIQQLPDREGTYSWGLSTDDIDRLEARPIYIEADSVKIAGQ